MQFYLFACLRFYVIACVLLLQRVRVTHLLFGILFLRLYSLQDHNGGEGEEKGGGRVRGGRG